MLRQKLYTELYPKNSFFASTFGWGEWKKCSFLRKPNVDFRDRKTTLSCSLICHLSSSKWSIANLGSLIALYVRFTISSFETNVKNCILNFLVSPVACSSRVKCSGEAVGYHWDISYCILRKIWVICLYLFLVFSQDKQFHLQIQNLDHCVL